MTSVADFVFNRKRNENIAICYIYILYIQNFQEERGNGCFPISLNYISLATWFWKTWNSMSMKSD